MRTTLKEVARESGLSLSAVSYALRGAPNIPAATAERVRTVAQRLGYLSNPRVGELMAHIRRGHPVERGERIAFLWSDAPWKVRSFRSFFQGALQRAGELGYGVEEFWLQEPGMTHARLFRILRSRGITGLILSPLNQNNQLKLEWDWNVFSPAILGNAACSPELHRAGHHHFLSMRLALGKLNEAGCRHMAAILDPDTNERAKRAWSASFLEHHPQRKGSRRFLCLEKSPLKKDLYSWLKTIGADSVICNSHTAGLLCPAGSARCQGRKIAVLDCSPGDKRWSGVNQGEEILGAQAVDLVAGQLYHNERGAPEHPKMLLFPGRWQEP